MTRPSTATHKAGHHTPPGVARPRRFFPPLHWELISCGVGGHMLLGTDAAQLRPKDAIFAREDADGFRRYRCVRCDSWVALPPPEDPPRKYPPDREEVELPLRGRALRDKIVLRIIAVDRAFHAVLFAIVAAAIFVFAAKEQSLRQPAYRILADIQAALGGPNHGNKGHGVIDNIRHLFDLKKATLRQMGLVATAYAVLESTEAVGLWYMKRWAEYLTFIATTALLPLEIKELIARVTVFRVTALVVNLAIVAYLLYAKRLFGIRGGGAAEAAERAKDIGWAALERTAPGMRAEPEPAVSSAAAD